VAAAVVVVVAVVAIIIVPENRTYSFANCCRLLLFQFSFFFALSVVSFPFTSPQFAFPLRVCGKTVRGSTARKRKQQHKQTYTSFVASVTSQRNPETHIP